MGTGNSSAQRRLADGARLTKRIVAVMAATAAVLALGWAVHAAPSLAYATHTGPVVFDDNSKWH